MLAETVNLSTRTPICPTHHGAFWVSFSLNRVLVSSDLFLFSLTQFSSFWPLVINSFLKRRSLFGKSEASSAYSERADWLSTTGYRRYLDVHGIAQAHAVDLLELGMAVIRWRQRALL
jgi:hypothetical protein